MADRYRNFAELSKHKLRDQDYRIRFRIADGQMAVIAPHGGGIEPGTSEIADAIAAEDYSYYAFEGVRERGNACLHITSTRFDEPTCLALVEAAGTVIAIHGEESRDVVAYIGGTDEETLGRLRKSLERRSFDVRVHKNPGLQGKDPTNICNRSKKGRGVQLELSFGLRQSFFQTLTRAGRRQKTVRFQDFIQAVRDGLKDATEVH